MLTYRDDQEAFVQEVELPSCVLDADRVDVLSEEQSQVCRETLNHDACIILVMVIAPMSTKLTICSDAVCEDLNRIGDVERHPVRTSALFVAQDKEG